MEQREQSAWAKAIGAKIRDLVSIDPKLPTHMELLLKRLDAQERQRKAEQSR